MPTVTVTTAVPNGFANGDSVTISGAAQSALNGQFPITLVSATQFQYTVSGISITESADAGPDISATKGPLQSLDDTISRVTALVDHGGTSAAVPLAAYNYLGLGTIVLQNSPENNTELTYIEQTGDGNAITDAGDRYTGLDRFGRVDDQSWLNTSTGTATDRIQYGYDRGSNVLYAKNLINSSFSELYHANSSTSGDNNTAYDPLSRLTTFRRGTLTSSGNNGSSLDTITTANLNSTTGVPNTNSWNLDALGNWASGAGSSNTFNSQNEATANGSNGLAYDNAGDITTDEGGNHFTWDAWGHLVYIANGTGGLVQSYAYDAMGRTTCRTTAAATCGCSTPRRTSSSRAASPTSTARTSGAWGT